MAILMVFAWHAFGAPLMWSGVDLFFILSGYLITGILMRDRARQQPLARSMKIFYLRRAQRILPAYLLVLLLFGPFLHVNWGRLWPYYAFFLQNVPYALGWVGLNLAPLWSLAVEQHFYLIWPFLVLLAPRRILAPLLIAILLVEPVVRGFGTFVFHSSVAITTLTFFRLDAVAAGAAISLWIPNADHNRARRLAGIVLAASMAIYAVLLTRPWFNRTHNTVAFNSLGYSFNILILGSIFVLVLLSDGILKRVLSNSVLRYLGTISYAFYLAHEIVMDWVKQHVNGRPAIAAVTMAVTVAVASASWFFVERPVLAMGRTR